MDKKQVKELSKKIDIALCNIIKINTDITKTMLEIEKMEENTVEKKQTLKFFGFKFNENSMLVSYLSGMVDGINFDAFNEQEKQKILAKIEELSKSESNERPSYVN